MITVDTNPGEDAVFRALHDEAEAGVEVRRERLDVGDIVVQCSDDSKVCIERKTWPDLCASICDGRLGEQKSRMVEDNVRYVYAIEGAHVEGWNGFYRGSMRNKSMWGALVKIQFRDHIGVVHTQSSEDTAAFALYVAHQLRHGGFETKATSVVSGVQKRKRDNLADAGAALRAMLTVLPGMSSTKADAVLRSYPGVKQLVDASQAELASLPCENRKLGPKMADAIKKVFC